MPINPGAAKIYCAACDSLTRHCVVETRFRRGRIFRRRRCEQCLSKQTTVEIRQEDYLPIKRLERSGMKIEDCTKILEAKRIAAQLLPICDRFAMLFPSPETEIDGSMDDWPF